ncbi:3-hydroxyisobutyryl-CoA hydrolase, mitochondrial [Pseudolycoriella hygida]|uniref:3-hydroxyisobutyryl-CoA hydrolase, mitochondrial n=1 Tax=Pseudolycoriella hygida TaxID=35572 RepID=A0A9Q0MWZ7_9DIPT|nr:3-hydroxyisobutyryl-CoA hydrolase, mitochondrial [Pseudolycoriella hygida]
MLLSRQSNIHAFTVIRNCVRSMASDATVLVEERGRAGIVTLNRTKALNALNTEMVRNIYAALLQFERDKSLVIIKGAGGKAFCAGGDVRSLVEKDLSYGEDFFRSEYTLNHLIGTYTIPYIAIIDGITLGGGVGISVHGKYRIATEKTVFAMPETAIGLFPDVGGSYFLPRLDGKLGNFFGLTGFRLKGKDVLKGGIATHYCESSKLPSLENELVGASGFAEVEATLSKYSIQDDSEFVLAKNMNQINKCFGSSTVEEIVANLEKDGSEWAQKTKEALSKASPTALKVTLKAISFGSKLSLADSLRMEFRLGNNHLRDSDFHEGVRALLIDKTNQPKWKPPTLEEVTDSRVSSFFEQVSGVEDLDLYERF